MPSTSITKYDSPEEVYQILVICPMITEVRAVLTTHRTCLLINLSMMLLETKTLAHVVKAYASRWGLVVIEFACLIDSFHDSDQVASCVRKWENYDEDELLERSQRRKIFKHCFSFQMGFIIG